MDAIEQKILSCVERLEPEIIDFASRLVSQASTLGNEEGALGVFEIEMKRLGFQTHRVPIDPEILAGHPGFAPAPWNQKSRFTSWPLARGREWGPKRLAERPPGRRKP